MEGEARHGGTMVVVPSDAAEVIRGRSAIMYRIGGRLYPFRTVPQCDTCQSDFRIEIENLLLRGYTYTMIWRSLPEKGQRSTSIESIRTHVHRAHMPLDEMMSRVLIEDRANELGKSVTEGEQALADHIAFARVGVARVFNDIQSGRQHPNINHAIRLANLLVKVELAQSEGAMDNEVLQDGMAAYWDAVLRVCSPEQVQAIGQDINANPVIKRILEQNRERDAIEANYVIEGDDDDDDPA